MTLKTKKEGNVVTKLASGTQLPRMVKIRQLLDRSYIDSEDIPALVAKELEPMRPRIRKGMRVAITCGSRGVANVAIITKTIVDFIKSCAGDPFVFPAMGSHGGATTVGQREILTSYGITEEFLGCPILASMEVVQAGQTEEGMPVFVDRYAYEAEGIILWGRVKAHTAFRGPYESGILKMAVIGMGKQYGADHVHRDGFSDLGRLLPMIAKVIFEKTKILGAVAVVENAFDQICILEGFLKEEIFEREPDLLRRSKQRLGRIFFDDIDVLVVDRFGKDISGDGMDPNITGRYAVPYMKSDKKVQHVAVLDLTEATHGNCNGIGLADVATHRLVKKIDVDCTYPNVVTSTVLCTPKIPLFTYTNKACIQIALKTCNYIDREHPRIVHIMDTMHLEEIEISEAMVEEARKNEHVQVTSEPFDWPFDKDGNLW
ncbi:MAG: lactate racemase domain-containing protein [Tepidanaerobacteraceae bacterium]|nr:lactate racemase domain-containing protein [Tepidanaerobacteraceae bacterium]